MVFTLETCYSTSSHMRASLPILIYTKNTYLAQCLRLYTTASLPELARFLHVLKVIVLFKVDHTQGI
jgi:hypothetical protein